MSDEQRVEHIAAVLAAGMEIRDRSVQRAAAARVIAFRRIKHMLATFGTDGLGVMSDQEFNSLLDMLADEQQLTISGSTT
jgi:hypothetical protein